MATTHAGPRRIAQIIRLKADSVAAYKECHAAAWPAVLAQIKDSNIVDYSIFLDESTLTLFASFKYVGNDWSGDMMRMKSNVEVQRWWQMTDGMQESFNAGADGSMEKNKEGVSWWKDIEEVFRVE